MIGKTTRKRLLDAANKSTLLANQAEMIIRSLLRERNEMDAAVDDLIFEPTNADKIAKINELRSKREKE
jgi:hypothetical protein